MEYLFSPVNPSRSHFERQFRRKIERKTEKFDNKCVKRHHDVIQRQPANQRREFHVYDVTATGINLAATIAIKGRRPTCEGACTILSHACKILSHVVYGNHDVCSENGPLPLQKSVLPRCGFAKNIYWPLS